MANAIDIIKKDHREVERAYEDYKGAGPEEKEELARKLFSLLEAHADMEEEIFYPELRKKFSPAQEKRIDDALAEHAEVREIIEVLRRNDTSVRSFDTEMRSLMRSVGHHVREEETKLLPKAEKELGKELEEIGKKMEAGR